MKSKSTNEGLTCGNERTSLLTPQLDPTVWMGEKRGEIEREKKEERERKRVLERVTLHSL